MKRITLTSALFAFLLVLGAAVTAHATPMPITEDIGSLEDNVWSRGEIYQFTGSGIDLAAGHQSLFFNLSGTVWADGGRKVHGWDKGDKIYARAYLNDSVIASKKIKGLNGQNKTFTVSFNLNLDLEEEGTLKILLYSKPSSRSELWMVDEATLEGLFAAASLDATSTEDPPVMPTPEPATMVLLGTGLIGVAAYGRKKRNN